MQSNKPMQKAPLIDLHRHLDGNIRISTILALATKNKIDLPFWDESSLSDYVYIQDKTSDLLAFLKKLDLGVSILADEQDCERIAYENVVDALKENLDHVELRFSPFYMAQKHNIPLDGVVDAVVSGVKRANREHKYNALLIGILSRTFGIEACFKELEAILTAKSDIVGIDLAGDELRFPAKLFKEHFLRAREHGLQVTVHAGEADGPQSIWDAIQLLGASRIGHGVSAIQDPQLLAYMSQHKIGIETCLLSNYQTGAWTDIPTHPVRTFLSHGIEVCLNTDDPGVSNNTLQSEYALAESKLKLNAGEITTLKLNALSQSFLSKAKKNAIKSRFNGV
jgi:adenosine deaminase